LNMNEKNSGYSQETEYLYKGDRVEGMDLKPEVIPCFLTTAFNMDDLNDVKEVYANKGYTYIRTRNPNRDALSEAVTYLEQGTDTDIFSSGMGAITSTLLCLLNPGDQIICNKDIYGETFNVLDEILQKMSVQVVFVPFDNPEDVRAAVTGRTRVIYTEVVSNPTIHIADLPALADIAYRAGARLVVDNTFTTPFSVKPLALGADIVINSLTKFLNGHSDAMGGSVTCRDAELLAKIHHIAMLCGTPGDPFSSWLILRGLHTAALRIPRQMETAARLAHTLAANPHISGVNHTSLASHPQWALSQRMGGEKGLGCPILSIYLPEDQDKMSQFMDRLNFARYAPTLGGIRTTLSHPVTSSHPNVPDDIRRAMGITPGLLRISVGTENADDLAADFEQAMRVFD